MRRSHVLIRNAIYNLVGQVWIFIIGFLSTPYIVHKLGDDAYGIFAIVTTVIGYFGFLNLGLGTAIVKFISEFHAKKDLISMRKAVGASLIVFIFMGIIGAIIFALLINIIVSRLLQIPANLMATAKLAFYISALGFLVNMPLNVFGAIPLALQRFDITNKIGILMGSMQTLVTVAILYTGYSLNEIILMNVIISVINIIVYIVISKKLIPELSIKPIFDLSMIGKLLKFGGFVSISRLTVTIANQLDRLVIGIFLPISQLTYYAVPKIAAQKLSMIPGNVTSVILPAASELDSSNNTKLISELFIRSNRYTILAVLPLAFTLMVFSKEILQYWLGPEFVVRSTLTFQILIFSTFIGAIGWTSGTIAQAIGKPEITTFIQLMQAVTNVLLCFILVPRMGITGAALALWVSYFIWMPIMIYLVIKIKIAIKVVDFLQLSFFKPLIIGLVISFGAFFLKPIVNSLLALLLVMFSIGLVYILIYWRLIIDDFDKKIFLSYFFFNKRY